MEAISLSKIKNTEGIPNWSELDHDLLGEIAVRVPLIEDFMAFRGVCSTWRAAARKNKFKPLQPSVPLLMLPGESYDSDEVVFYSLSRRKICMRLSLPQLKERHCIDARFGWLLVVDFTGHASEVSLFNPLSGAQIEIPNMRKIPPNAPYSVKYYYAKRAVLSASPSSTTNFVLMVSWSHSQGLGVWSAGEESWTDVKPLHKFIDITYYNGKFYAAREVHPYTTVEIWVWDSFGSDLNFVMQIAINFGWDNVYLVESSDGKLLLVARHHIIKDILLITVRRLDVLKCQWEKISCLGNDAIFLGGNASVSVAAPAFPDVVEPKCVYFTAQDEDDVWDGPDASLLSLGVYDFVNERYGSFDGIGYLLDDMRKPLWFAPSS